MPSKARHFSVNLIKVYVLNYLTNIIFCVSTNCSSTYNSHRYKPVSKLAPERVMLLFPLLI